MILVVNAIATHHGIEQGTVTLACDNESALWAAFGIAEVGTGESSFDIIRVIHHAIRMSPVTWHHRHVRGHQDDDKDRILDQWERANVEVDRLAEEYWNEQYSAGTGQRPTPPVMPGEGWRLELDGRPIVMKVEDQIYEHIHYERCTAYWIKKGRLREEMQDKVEWKRYEGAIRIMPQSKRQWVHKHFCGFEGTNYMLYKRQERRTDTCPS